MVPQDMQETPIGYHHADGWDANPGMELSLGPEHRYSSHRAATVLSTVRVPVPPKCHSTPTTKDYSRHSRLMDGRLSGIWVGAIWTALLSLYCTVLYCTVLPCPVLVLSSPSVFRSGTISPLPHTVLYRHTVMHMHLSCGPVSLYSGMHRLVRRPLVLPLAL